MVGGKNFSIKNSLISEKFESGDIKLSQEEYRIIEGVYFNKIKELLQENADIHNLYSVLGICERYLNYHLDLYLDFKNYILEA